MIKMFYLVYGLTSGGIERVSVDIYKYLDHNKIDMKLITKFAEREFFDDELELYGGSRTPILDKIPKSKIIKKVKYLVNVIKEINNNYDIAYFCLSKPRDVFKYPLLCRVFGIRKIIIHSHNSMEDNNSRLIRVLNYCGRKYIGKISTIKVACSDKAAKWMFPTEICKNGTYLKMNNGVDTQKYCYNDSIRYKLRKQWQVNSKFVVGHVGRFTKQKNHRFIIDIFEQIYLRHPDSQLMLIGVGELENDIKTYVESKNIADKVTFLGQKNNVNEYMQMFDVFLFPSLYEGLPVVGIEAQATGLKCFFSNTITQEVNITGNVIYIDLKKSAENWADIVLEEGLSYKRENTIKQIKKSGFDVEASVKELENAILNCMNNG